MSRHIENRGVRTNEARLAGLDNRFNVKLNASDSEVELVGKIVGGESCLLSLDKAEGYGRSIPKKLLPCRNALFLVAVVSAEE